MQIEVVPNERPGTCPLCREELGGQVRRCEGCGVVLHEECAGELRRCPTIGCPQTRWRRSGRVAARTGPPTVAQVPPVEIPPPATTPTWPQTIAAMAGLAIGCALCLGNCLWNVRLGYPHPHGAPTPPPARSPSPAPRQLPPPITLTRLVQPGPGVRSFRVTLESGARPSLRIDDRTWLVNGSSHEQWTIVPHPAQQGVDLMQLGNANYGVTRHGRVVFMGVTREYSPSSMRDSALLRPAGGDPTPPANAPAEWAAILEGDDPVAVQDALNWLRLERNATLPAGTVALIEATRVDPLITPILLRIERESRDPWLRSAAGAALGHHFGGGRWPR